MGFIPNPSLDVHDTRLDMRIIGNKIINKSISNLNPQDNNEHEDSKIPYKLFQKSYGPTNPTPDQAVNDIVEQVSNNLDNKLRKRHQPQKQNLSAQEKSGLQWLQQKTNDNEIAIVEADKGGAILIVYPELLKSKTLEKLNNPNLYEKLEEDPTHVLQKDLVKLWVKGKQDGLISANIAKEVMGVSDNDSPDGSGPTNRPSTLPHFKPGKAYYYPSLKIHKLSKEELVPGVQPPIRLITALQDGIAKRSDVFLAENYLKDLEKDFCKDLLTDTTDALKWLDSINDEHPTESKKQYNCFAFDFKALYDSLRPDLVDEALRYAMKQCRSEWTNEFVNWNF